MMMIGLIDFSISPTVEGWYGVLHRNGEEWASACYWTGWNWPNSVDSAVLRSDVTFRTWMEAIDWAKQQLGAQSGQEGS